MNRRLLPIALTVSLAALTGCGGAGSNSSENRSAENGGAPPRAAAAPASPAAAPAADLKRLGLFVAALPPKTPAYDHAWILVHRVELLDADEKAETVFEDPDGTLVDLAALGGEQTLPLGAPGVATERPIARVRLTLGPSVQLAAAGQTGAQTALWADALPRDPAGRPVMHIAREKPRSLASGKEDLVLAFDLATLAVTDGKASLTLREGGSEGIAQQIAQEFAGTIQGLSGDAPGQAFTLALPGGGSVAVQTGPETGWSHAGEGVSPRPGEGQPAIVRGVLDPATKRLRARRVALGKPERAQAAGAAAAVDAKGGTFQLAARRFRGLLPTQTVLTVTLAEGATLRSAGGLTLAPEAFWSALAAPEARVEVEGTYEPVTGALLARRLRLEDDGKEGAREALLVAAATTVDEKAGTLTLAAPTAWEGILPPAKESALALGPAVALKDEQGQPMALPAFLSAVKERSVRVIGLIDAAGKLTPTRLELRPAEPKPVVKEAEAKTEEKKPAEAAGVKKPARPETKEEKPAEPPAKPADIKGT